MGWGKAKDDLAGDKAEAESRRFGKVVDKLTELGHTAAADNVTKGAGRFDSPEAAQEAATRRAEQRGGSGRGE